MKSRLVFLTPLMLAVGLGLILYTALGKDPSKLETARLNDPLPTFSLQSLEYPSKLLTNADLGGKPSLLNVWATWCPACKSEHGYLMALAQQGVPIIGLNYKDDRAKALQWLDRLGDPYSLNLFDPRGKFGFDLGVYGAPETYIIDQNGVVRYRHVGEVNHRVWEAQLAPRFNALLKE
ncbi:thiol:disulfide interchange protein [Oleiphilus sp. HI0009]|uniref:DsbE family thiol:disulfide interchange protein n=2 Tax=Oleiphilus TaxID=141450 RepID=UPI0007C26C89|nr:MULTISPECIES: DsbE family thiol:disulfide interchange protein [unclassified Oleiphilus]KZX81656.1 thiol:disulfide interchange protein [Oleiphilus sp. HI0009]KZX83455.1 thiol:disulfide interchange protein [Oleiphilus sp. HI0009]KZY65041.1 thiol:disulfide interchange protein [Oleiphilus sp. HI0066]KZY68704.1 thiol:disulfide interchange protein [Oleiphilus sp. HI0066]KZY71424.1 thiol:disulfide interchange protein [Oleiphilus sp. HI0067]